MRQHTNAALTPRPRTEIQVAVAAKTLSKRASAIKYGVHLTTIARWAHRADGQKKPSGRPPVAATDYEGAILAHRTEHPTHGPLRIAGELRADFPQAHRTAIWRVLRQAGMSRRAPKKNAP